MQRIRFGTGWLRAIPFTKTADWQTQQTSAFIFASLDRARVGWTSPLTPGASGWLAVL